MSAAYFVWKLCTADSVAASYVPLISTDAPSVSRSIICNLLTCSASFALPERIYAVIKVSHDSGGIDSVVVASVEVEAPRTTPPAVPSMMPKDPTDGPLPPPPEPDEPPPLFEPLPEPLSPVEPPPF